MSGTGETEDGRTIFNPFRALQAGRSIPGIQAADILRVFYFLKGRPDIRQDEIAGIAVRDAEPAMLHAALFGKEIRKICLIESLTSYKSLVLNPRYDYDLALMIPSVLTAYDLPDLMAALAPRPLLLVNAADNTGLPAPQAWVEDEVAFARKVYAARGAEESFMILSRDETMPHESALKAWLAR